MAKNIKSYSPEFKIKIALEAIKNDKTLNQIASEHAIPASLICDWKKKLQEA